jgi:hypothetical protein
VHNIDTSDEQLVTRVVAAVLRELADGRPPPPAPLDPEARITDPQARKQLYGNCSRTKFWQLMKRPDAPQGHRLGRSIVRRVRDHLGFISKNPV